MDKTKVSKYIAVFAGIVVVFWLFGGFIYQMLFASMMPQAPQENISPESQSGTSTEPAL